MIVKVDVRESDLLQQVNQLIENIPIFKNIIVKSEVLPIGDIIISDEKEEKLIIERKSVNDLLASIKDGRYNEQSYRLNGNPLHNHNIIYLIEGDVNRTNTFKSKSNGCEKLTLYSAMFSLNYYKGFSVFRSFSLGETATIICNMAYKLGKETKMPYYPPQPFQPLGKVEPNLLLNQEPNLLLNQEPNLLLNQEPNLLLNKEQNQQLNQQLTEEQKIVDGLAVGLTPPNEDNLAQPFSKVEDLAQPFPKVDYVHVIKKVKKENITPENIGEIMLCQIPGISAVTAVTIMGKFKTLPSLIKELEINQDCLKDIQNINEKGQSRKINKTSIANIVKYLLKK